jgi:hypothetical protein
MHKIAFVFILLQLLAVRVCLVPLFVTIAISSHAFLVTQCFVLFVLKHHPYTWNLFDSKHFYNFIILRNCITLDMFYILLIVSMCGFMER